MDQYVHHPCVHIIISQISQVNLKSNFEGITLDSDLKEVYKLLVRHLL